MITKYIAALFLFMSSYGFVLVEAEPLVIGMELSYPPFEMIDKDGNPTGISVDMAYALGEYLNRPVRIENLPFMGLIPSLKTGRIDLIISSLTVTPQREQAIDFSEPYLQTGLSLLVNINSHITTVDQLNDRKRKVVVKLGTTGEVYAEENLKQAKILALATETSAVLEIVQDKADAFIYDQLSILTNWQKNPNDTKPILEPFYKEYWAIGIGKNNQALKEQVNRFIKEYKQNKGFEKLAEKYIPVQIQEFNKLGIPFIL